MKEEYWNPVKGIALKLFKNMMIIAFIFVASKYIKGETIIPDLNSRENNLGYILLFVPWVALSFLYPFTKYGVTLFLYFLTPKRYIGRVAESVMSVIIHVITIMIWMMVFAGIVSPINTEPMSRPEYYLGL